MTKDNLIDYTGKGLGVICSIFASVAIPVGAIALVGNLTLNDANVVQETATHIKNSAGTLAMGVGSIVASMFAFRII